MTFADLSIVVFQVVLPAALLAWLLFAPAASFLLYVIQVVTIGSYLAALTLVPIWFVPPWWVPWIYIAAGVSILASQLFRRQVPTKPRWPQSRPGRIATVVLALVAAGLASIAFQALAGRSLPGAAVDLAFPMGPGTYLVASGGSTQTVNGHLLTLEPKTDRQRAYRGQSHGVDLVKLGRLGLRAPGWRPEDPSAYAIFGEPVHAPCAGEVLAAQDGMPDMPVPEMDTSRLEGNHVFIDCGNFGVLLAHFRDGSVKVKRGDRVDVGDELGEGGNSGQTGEPHLHVHAQRIPADGPLLFGEPLFVTFDGRFLVRNDRVKVGHSP